MPILKQGFHNYVDQYIRAYQASNASQQWNPTQTYITLRNRSLTYQFFPHFHPYVTQLIQRLKDGGFAELAASDTLYLPQPNPSNAPQPLTVIPNSTRATLAENVTAIRPADGTSLSLTAGTPLTLPDLTWVTVPVGATVAHPDGSTSQVKVSPFQAQLPGNLPVSYSSGIQWQDTIVPDSTLVFVTLPPAPSYAILNDGSAVQLPPTTAVAIRSGLPYPFFYEGIFDPADYGPDTPVVQPYPVKNIDFTYDGAYSIYNWEVFFHAPLLIAVHLSQNQKFQDAQRWFHYIFDPTGNSPGPTPERFWKVQPFQYTDAKMIEQILVNLSTQQDPELQQQTVNSINAWMQNPFQPWEVARFRPTAYMLKTVMAYLDNLIAWGDSLFQQYTIETINEATQIYIMAANILGPKPQAVPKKGSVKPLTYNDLRGDNLDAFGNALVEMEADIPFDFTPPAVPPSNPGGAQILPSIGQSLYFCIPRNDKLLAYWDTVADRLFKIHNSLNLQGIFQKLPLFDPPIDPALLVRAAASGLDVSAVVAGINQPLPLVRFQMLVAKALEICQEVQSLGAALLSAIEKQDNESISLMRAQHENAILGLAEIVKYSQWQDAIKASQGLQQSLTNAMARYGYYQKLLGRTEAQIQSSIPQLAALDHGSLENLNFSQSDPGSEPTLSLDPLNPNIAKNPASVTDGEMITLSNNEVAELAKLQDSRSKQISAANNEGLAATLGFVPDFSINLEPMGVGSSTTMGGTYASKFPMASARSDRADAEGSTYEANKTAKLGSYSRRQLDWMFQSNSIKGEISQIFKQLRGSQIREAIAKKEFENHQVQMQNAQQIVDFLQGNPVSGGFQVKETTIGFYAWMKREVKGLYAKAFNLAFETAKKAERALQNELGDPSLSYVQFNYLDGIEGLLAGEKLLFDIKTMEMAYHDLNQREYELTKHVSLRQVDPLALMQLRSTGTCSFNLPEELFDMDGPGHYFRRIKSVAVSVPCVTGPYTSVNCTLSLEKSSIRISTDVANSYPRKGSDDPRFNDYYGTLQAIVTSSGQSDSGLFETNLKDERYLPFEGAGVAGSQWQLALPSDVRQFDFDTITDIVIHVRYTAREGGEVVKTAALQNLQTLIKNAQTVGSIRLFSVRQEFPSEWAKFQSASSTPAELSLSLTAELYPFWAQGIVDKSQLKAVEFFAEMLAGSSTNTVNGSDKPQGGNAFALSRNPLLGNLLMGNLPKASLPAAISNASHPLTLYFDNNSMEDLWLAIIWGK